MLLGINCASCLGPGWLFLHETFLLDPCCFPPLSRPASGSEKNCFSRFAVTLKLRISPSTAVMCMSRRVPFFPPFPSTPFSANTFPFFWSLQSCLPLSPFFSFHRPPVLPKAVFCRKVHFLISLCRSCGLFHTHPLERLKRPRPPEFPIWIGCPRYQRDHAFQEQSLPLQSTLILLSPPRIKRVMDYRFHP